MHFRHEKFVPLGGPDGGDGGQGGDVALHATRGLNTLYSFKRQRIFKAESGTPGGPSRMHGRKGDSLAIEVPIGTVIRDGESGDLLGDLTRDGDDLLVARGGKGGLGNVHFKSSTHQAPKFAERGEPGQQRWLDLELKLIADVGLIGVPNAGKSTLLSVISAARPKIAGYPFTTLTPNLGVVNVGDYSFVAADIPGLIEGAHEGVGLGHEFLRHIERTRVLVHLVDSSSPDPLGDFQQVIDELLQYDEKLMKKPQIVALNKIDLVQDDGNGDNLPKDLRALGHEVFFISAVTREGVDRLVQRVAALLIEVKSDASEDLEIELPVIVPQPPADYFEVERKRHTLYVRGETVERLVVMTDMESDDGVYRLQQRLRRMGVFSALQRAGATEGSRIVIGDTEFHWDSMFEPQAKPARSNGG